MIKHIDKIHNKLTNRYNWYQKYHQWEHHHQVHWAALAVYVLSVISFGFASFYEAPRAQAVDPEISATLTSGSMPLSASYTAPPVGSNTNDAVYNISVNDIVTSYSFTLTCSGPTLASPRWKVYTSSDGGGYSEIDTLDCQGDIPISGGSATISGTIAGTVYYIKLSAIAQSGMLPGTYTVTISEPHFYGTSSDPPPTVSIGSPSNNCVGDKHYTRSSDLTVSGTASDTAPGTISSVTVNGSAATGTTSWSKSGVSLNSGDNTITAQATDNSAQTASASITVNRDSVAPSVTISSPAEGTVTSSSTATVSGSASDNSGGSGLTAVSSSTGSSVSGASNWSTSVNLSAGANTITLTATDCAGNQASQSVGIVYQTGSGGGTDQDTKSITVTAPNGGENYLIGSGSGALSFINITWTTQNISASEKIKLSYTTNNSTYATIADNESNDGSYPWTLPQTKSSSVKVKAELTTDATVADTSDHNLEFHSNAAPEVRI